MGLDLIPYWKTHHYRKVILLIWKCLYVLDDLFFLLSEKTVLFKIYFKNLVLTFEIFRDKICSVIPVFTVLFLLLFFQIIEIRQCCGFTFTIFFCFLTATNALTTSWVTFSNTSVFFVFPLFCFDFPIVAWWK